MRVQMEDQLSGMLAVVDLERVVVLDSQLCRNLLNCYGKPGDCRWRSGLECISVGAWANQNVHCGFRVNVAECDVVFIDVEKLPGNLTGDDFAKDAVGHCWQRSGNESA